MSEAAPPSGGLSLRNLLVRGGLTLGLAVGLERGLNFISNLLAARIGGPEVFGAYSIVLVTAGTVATYAGAGIGTTANRFAGVFPRDSIQYRHLLRALIFVSLGSTIFAAGLLFIGAAPFASLILHNPNLTGLLRLAACSAAAMILLECCRGLLIGQQKFPALLLLSSISGIGLLLILPTVARLGPRPMVGAQACVGLLAVGACVIFSRRLGIAPSPVKESGPQVLASELGVGSVLKFGMVQLAAVIGLNIAGWWLTSLVARADATLFQMGLYAVANQFRQLATIFPDLLARVCYPLMTKETGERYGGADRVMLVNTYIITVIAIAVGGFAITILPWILPGLYGRAYAAGEIPCALLLSTAIVHMSGAPAANRLNILNLRAAGIINAIWTVFLISLGTVAVPRAGVAGAAFVFLLTHLLSASLVLLVLRRTPSLSRGMWNVSITGMAAAMGLSLIALARAALGQKHELMITGALGIVVVFFLLYLVRFGRLHGWIPSAAELIGSFSRFKGSLKNNQLGVKQWR